MEYKSISYSVSYRDIVHKNNIEAQDIINAKDCDALAVREKILRLQDVMLSMPDKVECTNKHWFAPGVYGREMLIPKGTVIIGKIHKHAHLNIVSRGKCSVMTEFGPMVIDATSTPHTFTSEPGTKRVVVALEDVVWTTIHLNPTNTQDLEVLENEIIAKNYTELSFAEEIKECLP